VSSQRDSGSCERTHPDEECHKLRQRLAGRLLVRHHPVFGSGLQRGVGVLDRVCTAALSRDPAGSLREHSLNSVLSSLMDSSSLLPVVRFGAARLPAAPPFRPVAAFAAGAALLPAAAARGAFLAAGAFFFGAAFGLRGAPAAFFFLAPGASKSPVSSMSTSVWSSSSDELGSSDSASSLPLALPSSSGASLRSLSESFAAAATAALRAFFVARGWVSAGATRQGAAADRPSEAPHVARRPRPTGASDGRQTA